MLKIKLDLAMLEEVRAHRRLDIRSTDRDLEWAHPFATYLDAPIREYFARHRIAR